MSLLDDVYDRTLRDHTHPVGWESPTPQERYTLVVVGGGPAGLVAALGAAGLGARVALIERGLLGGDCLVHGCVPSKAVLRAAHAVGAVEEAARFGVQARVEQVDVGAVMERMRRIRAGIAPHDSAARLRDEGIDVFFGEARFVGEDSVQVGSTVLRFHRCCIATGARAARPPIPGLDKVEVLTNEELFALEAAPDRLLIVGGGVIGCEMAQAFARLGSAVTVVDQAERVLGREDPEAATVVQDALVQAGVDLRLGGGVARFEARENERVAILADGSEIAADAILLAVGRSPNVDLDLHRAGVRHGPRGVEVDDRLRTSNPRIFAAGDVIGGLQLTHAADHQARIVIQNALFHGRKRASSLIVPRVVYTRPELASVGLTGEEAASRADLKAWTVGVGETDRGRTDGESAGFCRVWADRRGRIHGAVIVGEQAGELLAPVTLAMTHGLGLGAIAGTIHAYPTRSEVLFKVASAWNRERLPGWAKRLLAWWFGR